MVRMRSPVQFRLWAQRDSLEEGVSRMRDLIALACEECKEKNYTTDKNKKNTPSKLQFKKYCPRCGKHTLHKETNIK